MALFFRALSRLPGTPPADASYEAWHRWSVEHPSEFWATIAGLADLIVEDRGGRGPWDAVLEGGDRMAPPDPTRGPRWFPGVRLNYAEHCLRRDDDAPALIARHEDGTRREVSWRALRAAVAAAAAALRALGVQPGDRVAGILPNAPEAIIAALAAATVGAVWSSCSPDFGVGGILDRFGQIEPVVLLVADGYRYDGKRVETWARAREVADRLPSVRRVVLVPFLDAEGAALPPDPRWQRWDEFLLGGAGVPYAPTRLPFDHPLFVMYSSGTTGKPKAMVHGAGGTLLQHVKEHRLHTDLRPGDRLFYFTTCGWMMWNWLLSGLASGVTLVLYDGAPLPTATPGVLWDLAAEERVTVFGTSAKFLALSEKAGLAPARTHDLDALRAILSTGSPLADHSFDYVLRDVRPGVHLASISGGTDLISCFALGNPMLPVWRGELQCLGLGMAVDVWDEGGRPLRGAAGELVCTRPFPSMPVAFWDDPDGARYRGAYFEHFAGVWRHGDWAERTVHGGLRILGRSDATLNPGGVRIGTAEIYRQVEQLPEVLESVVIGQDVPDGAGGTDVRVVLFVRLREGVAWDDALAARIRRQVRDGASPHHVPKVILPVADIPRTVSGKISEIAVREVVHGRPVRNTEALANPGSLALYVGILRG